MKSVPRALLERLEALVPAGADVVPLTWAYDGEDYHVAVFVDQEDDRRGLEDRLLDAVMDYDEAHGTFTTCLVWPKHQRTVVGVK